MDEELTHFLARVQKLQRELNKIKGAQVDSAAARKEIYDLSLEYIRGLRPQFGGLANSEEAQQAGQIFSELLNGFAQAPLQRAMHSIPQRRKKSTGRTRNESCARNVEL